MIMFIAFIPSYAHCYDNVFVIWKEQNYGKSSISKIAHSNLISLVSDRKRRCVTTDYRAAKEMCRQCDLYSFFLCEYEENADAASFSRYFENPVSFRAFLRGFTGDRIALRKEYCQ